MPVTFGRAANLPFLSRDRAAGGFTGNRAARLSPVTSGRAATLAPIASRRAARLAPVTSGRAAGLAPIARDRAASLAPVASRRAAGLAPVISRRAAKSALISRDRAASLMPVAGGRAASLLPVTTGRAAYVADLLPEGTLPTGYVESVAESRFPLVKGSVAFTKGEYGKAAAAFADAADRHPDAAGPQFALADALVALGKWDGAARAVRAGLDLAPRWADSLDRRKVYGRAGDHEKHLRAAEEYALAHTVEADAWFLLGYLRKTSGVTEEQDRAAASFRQALSLSPEDSHALRFSR